MTLAVFDVTKKPATPLSGKRVEAVKQLTLDNSYVTGGYSLTAAMLGLSAIDFVSVNGVAGYQLEYDYAANKVKVMYGDNNNASDGPLIEVPNTTDLSALAATRLLARGTAA